MEVFTQQIESELRTRGCVGNYLLSKQRLGKITHLGEQRGAERGSPDFPGGTVHKNPPTNAGNTGSIPGPGRSHMPQSN